MHKLLYTFISLIAILLCGSCHQTTEKVVEKDSLTLQLGVLPTVECLPFYYADSAGLFDSLGVTVKLVTFDAAMDADTAFMNGCIDGITTDLVKACIWQNKGDSTYLAMVAELRLWLVTAPNARLLKAESLKEKIIGITRHSAVDYFTDKVLSSVKLQSIDLNKPQINNLQLRTLMIDQNQLDGAILPDPYASEAVARGAKRLTGTKDLGIGNLMCVLFNDSIYQARKDEIELIRKAYDKAVVAMNADTLSNLLSFFPKEHQMYLPDTLFTYSPLKTSIQPTDSIMQDVRRWIKERGIK
ncbi:MAG: hypothetical protein IJ693_01865 [Bacteroidaceae bacterium]|nr:hypothetical protein [Bacteroidaceae bacterium]